MFNLKVVSLFIFIYNNVLFIFNKIQQIKKEEKNILVVRLVCKPVFVFYRMFCLSTKQQMF